MLEPLFNSDLSRESPRYAGDGCASDGRTDRMIGIFDTHWHGDKFLTLMEQLAPLWLDMMDSCHCHFRIEWRAEQADLWLLYATVEDAKRATVFYRLFKNV